MGVGKIDKVTFGGAKQLKSSTAVDALNQHHATKTTVRLLKFLANPLTKRTLLVFGQIYDVFNTSRNMLFKSSIKAMKIGLRNK